MINVSMLMKSPYFTSSYKVIRRKGEFVGGRFRITEETFDRKGPVQPATPRELEQLDIGDTNKGVMKFFCAAPDGFFLSRDGDDFTETGVSDLVEYKGRRYKIIQVVPWLHNGYCRAYGVLTGGG